MVSSGHILVMFRRHLDQQNRLRFNDHPCMSFGLFTGDAIFDPTVSSCTACIDLSGADTSPLVLIRSIGGQLVGGGDTTNMVNWVNGYDITTVAWDDYHQ